MPVHLYARLYSNEVDARRVYEGASSTQWEGKVGFEIFEVDDGWVVAAIGFDPKPVMVQGGEPCTLDDETVSTLRLYWMVKQAHADVMKAEERERGKN